MKKGGDNIDCKSKRPLQSGIQKLKSHEDNEIFIPPTATRSSRKRARNTAESTTSHRDTNTKRKRGAVLSEHRTVGDTAHIVTYFETRFADKGKVRGLALRLSDASVKEEGNLRFEVLQRIGQPDHFLILEAWKDKTTAAAHADAAHTKEFREKLDIFLRSAYDERPHTAIGVGEANIAKNRCGIFSVTHVDIIPTEKERGVDLVKEMVSSSRSDAGNVRCEALIQSSRANHMTVIEIWKDKASKNANEAGRHKISFRKTLTSMSGSLYDERFYRQIN